MGGQPLFVVQSYEQINMTRSRFHPWGSEPDDGEDLHRDGWQPSTDHDRYLFDPVSADHLDIAICIYERHVVHAVRDGAYSLVALDGLLRDPYTL